MKLLHVTDKDGKKALVNIERIERVTHFADDKWPNIKACIVTQLGVGLYVTEGVNKIYDDIQLLDSQP